MDKSVFTMSTNNELPLVNSNAAEVVPILYLIYKITFIIWNLSPKISRYLSMVRSALWYAALVWWPRGGQK